ncbi:MAG: helix-turn-helix transcriptional regulator, partial [Alphaproteobacteria bacterium]|nr:helix-turn-helix transcriptional regulator [Alphaproteobacteria bacterium]
KLGISFQQLQKYEVGANRLSVSRLIEMSSLLKVSVATIIGDTSIMPDDIEARSFMRLYHNLSADARRCLRQFLEVI